MFVKDGFVDIYNVIMDNINTIERLIKVYEYLDVIITSVSTEESNIKDELQELEELITKLIGDFVSHTKKLSQAYNNLIEEVCSNGY